MADQDIEIRFRSTREGSGGADTIDELDDVNERIEEMKDRAAALRETTDEIGDSADNAGGGLDKLISLERAQVAAQLGEVTRQLAGSLSNMASQLESVDPESADKLNDIALATTSVGNGLDLAAKGFAVGGPFGAAIGGTIGLMTGPLKGAFNGMISDLQAAKVAQDNAAKAEQQLRELIRLRGEEARRANAAEFYRDQVIRINEGNAALERRIQLLNTQRQVEEGIALENIKQAEIAGGDSGVAEQQRNQVALNQKLAELQLRVDRAELNAQKLEDLASVERSAATDAQGSQGRRGLSDQDVLQALIAADNAEAAAEDARANVELIKQQKEEQERLIAEQVETSYAELGSNVGDLLTEAARAGVEIFNQAEQEVGTLTANAVTFRGQLQKLLNDAIPDEEQAQQIRQVLELSRTTQEARDQTIFDLLTEQIAITREADSQLKSFRSELEAMREQIQSNR